MLEGLATWFLNNYLGKYLENLDTDQLSISLLSGQVELENVPLRKDALRFVEPAIEVKSGIVGHIKLTIPVSRLRSEPWTLLLEKVAIVLGPQKFSQYDEEADDQVLNHAPKYLLKTTLECVIFRCVWRLSWQLWMV